jgi:hypothetical protein
MRLDYNEQVGTGIRYNWVDLCCKWTFGTKIFVLYNQVFVITEFHCNMFIHVNVFLQFAYFPRLVYLIKIFLDVKFLDLKSRAQVKDRLIRGYLRYANLSLTSE